MLDLTLVAARTAVSHGPPHRVFQGWATYLQSISFPVFASLTISRTQGGGVMGRRSYFSCEPLVPFDRARSQVPKRQAYLVTKPTHPRTLWLLHNIKAAGARISVCSQDRRTHMRCPAARPQQPRRPGSLRVDPTLVILR
jgi:hypothetical protein